MVALGQRPSCRSCRHCTPPSAAEPGWCQLRRLPIHPELAAELWCHHWTARPPRLPVVAETGTAPLVRSGNRQLSLSALLPET